MKFFLLALTLGFLIGCQSETKEKSGSPEITPEKDSSDKADRVSRYYGIDISQYNGDVVTEIPKKDSLTFIICKATEGVTLIDPDFSSNWKWIKEKGFVRGAYHFYHFNDEPIQQAEFFLSVVKNLDSADLSLIVDVEEASLAHGVKSDPDKMLNDLLKFLNHLQEKTGRIPIFYTDYTFANEYLTDSVYANYPLWLAEYVTDPSPKIPVAWNKKGFFIWQKSDSYTIQSEPLDFDLFIGKKEDLLK